MTACGLSLNIDNISLRDRFRYKLFHIQWDFGFFHVTHSGFRDQVFRRRGASRRGENGDPDLTGQIDDFIFIVGDERSQRQSRVRVSTTVRFQGLAGGLG